MKGTRMADRFRLTLAQLNATVGDLAGNSARARTAWEAGRAAGADLVALPEMFITGYNTQDLVMKPAFHQAAIAAIARLARDCANGPAIAIGGPALEGAGLYNAYYILQGGQVTARVFKHHLPNETVFDEKRIYQSGDVTGPYTVRGLRIGSPICEDAWHEDVAETLAETGAEMLLVPNGSPHYRGKIGTRQNLMVARVIETGLPLVYLNLVGGQDDQVFDGGSFVLNPGGGLVVQLPMFEEAVAHIDFERGAAGWQCRARWHISRMIWNRITTPWFLPCATICARPGFRVFCWGCRAGWTVRLSRQLRSMRSGQRMYAALCCLRNIPRTSHWRMPVRSLKAWAVDMTQCRFQTGAPRSLRRLRRSSRGLRQI